MTIFKRNKEPLTPDQLSDHTWASALTDVLHARHTLHVPPQEDDEDMVINNAMGRRDATIRLLARELANAYSAIDKFALLNGLCMTAISDYPTAQQWIEWARQQEDDTHA